MALAVLLGCVLAFALSAGPFPANLFQAGPALAQQDAAGQPQNRPVGDPMQLPDDADPLLIRTAQGTFPISIEIAADPSERSRGLMFREEMETNHGMLFDFGRNAPVSMWMKNTPMSLDMVFIGKDGVVVNVAERTVPYSETVVSSDGPVAYVLELRAGVAKLVGLKPGDRMEHPIFGKAGSN